MSIQHMNDISRSDLNPTAGRRLRLAEEMIFGLNGTESVMLILLSKQSWAAAWFGGLMSSCLFSKVGSPSSCKSTGDKAIL